MWSVALWGMASEARVGDGDDVGGREVRWWPAWTRRIEEVGADVRRESRCWRVVTGVEKGIVRGMADGLSQLLWTEKLGVGGVLSPERSLTNMW